MQVKNRGLIKSYADALYIILPTALKL